MFSKIIDRPAEEALKHGLEYNISDQTLADFLDDALDRLDWEEKATTAIRWARLFGGAVIVMLLDDGRGLEEPVNWQDIRSVEELRVYERAIVQPDPNCYLTGGTRWRRPGAKTFAGAGCFPRDDELGGNRYGWRGLQLPDLPAFRCK